MNLKFKVIAILAATLLPTLSRASEAEVTARVFAAKAIGLENDREMSQPEFNIQRDRILKDGCLLKIYFVREKRMSGEYRTQLAVSLAPRGRGYTQVTTFSTDGQLSFERDQGNQVTAINFSYEQPYDCETQGCSRVAVVNQYLSMQAIQVEDITYDSAGVYSLKTVRCEF